MIKWFKNLDDYEQIGVFMLAMVILVVITLPTSLIITHNVRTKKEKLRNETYDWIVTVDGEEIIADTKPIHHNTGKYGSTYISFLDKDGRARTASGALTTTQVRERD